MHGEHKTFINNQKYSLVFCSTVGKLDKAQMTNKLKFTAYVTVGVLKKNNQYFLYLGHTAHAFLNMHF